jgi:hypothetical protein
LIVVASGTKMTRQVYLNSVGLQAFGVQGPSSALLSDCCGIAEAVHRPGVKMFNQDDWLKGKIVLLWAVFLYIVATLLMYAPRDWPFTVLLGLFVGIPLGVATRKWWRIRKSH